MGTDVGDFIRSQNNFLLSNDSLRNMFTTSPRLKREKLKWDLNTRPSDGRLLGLQVGKGLLDPEGRQPGAGVLVPALLHYLLETPQVLKYGK